MPVFQIRVFDATNLLNESGGIAIAPNQTNATLTGDGPYSTGDGGPFTLSIEDNGNNAAATTFQDGTARAQVLNEPATFTYSDGAGDTTTQTFAAGTQIQSEFQIEFSSGFNIIAIRLNPPGNGTNDVVTVGYAFVDENGNPVNPPPNTDLGNVVRGDTRATSNNGTVEYANVACFTPGTRIATPSGDTVIEHLRVGDIVRTDRGNSPITWIGRRVFSAPVASISPHLWPVRVAAGTLGARRALDLSPQHRVLIRDPFAMLYFDSAEVLVPAVSLLSMEGVSRVRPTGPLTYIHFSCTEHRIVRANGARVETLLAGADMIDNGVIVNDSLRAARPILRRREAELLLDAMRASHRAGPVPA